MKNDIKNIIKKTFLKEFMNGGTGWDSNNDISLFHGGGMQDFPYGKTTNIENGFEHIDIYNSATKNNDVYDFPIEEFKKGLKIEVAENKKNEVWDNIFQIAQMVIINLSENSQFYSKKSEYETDIENIK